MVDKLSNVELELVKTLHTKLQGHVVENQKLEAFYNGTHVAETYGIAIPPKMSALHAVVGWPAIVTDTLEERLDFTGYESPLADLGLDDIYTNNDLAVEASMVHHDALLFGSGFVVVGSGYDGEPSPLITVESPNSMTAIWDQRLRRCSSAFSVADDGSAQLYLPNETITLLKDGSLWRVLDRDTHNLGRVPVVRFDNRLRTKGHGQSEITNSVKYWTDAAARTAIRMEISSEFYSAPKEVILGGDSDLLMDENGNPTSMWSSYLGRVQQIPWNPDEENKTNPEMIQLDPADPKPFINQVQMFGEQLAADAGLPVSYLGLTTNLPTSADAIKAGEIRLIKRAERRQSIFSRGWMEVARLALLIRDGEIPAELSKVTPHWVDPSTPTRAATTDAVVKLVQSGILPADSSVVADELGFSTSQRAALEVERTKSRATNMFTALANQAPAA